MPDLALAADHEAFHRQRFQSHRAIGMQARGRDPDLGAQAQFAAVGEARGRVDHHHRRAQRVDEPACGGLVRGGDDFGMVGGVPAHVVDRLRQVVDHAHGDDQVEELGRIVVLARRRCVGQQRPGRRIAADLDPARAQRRAGRGQEPRRDVGVHQQRLQRIAHARPRGLAVEQQPQRQLLVGGAVHVQVAHALVVLDHRHARVLGDEPDQALATARDGQVDDVVELQQLEHGLAAQVGDQGEHGRIQARLADGPLQGRGDRGVGVDRLRAAAQDHAVAGLDAQRRRVGGHVRARLVDHGDDAQRHAHALDPDAVGAGLAAGDLADRVRQRGDLAQRPGDAGQARGIQGQAIEHRAARSPCAGGLEVARVGGEDGVGVVLQRPRHRHEQRVLGHAVQLRERLRGVAATQCLFPDSAGFGHCLSLAFRPGRKMWIDCRQAATAL